MFDYHTHVLTFKILIDMKWYENQICYFKDFSLTRIVYIVCFYMGPKISYKYLFFGN